MPKSAWIFHSRVNVSSTCASSVAVRYEQLWIVFQLILVEDPTSPRGDSHGAYGAVVHCVAWVTFHIPSCGKSPEQQYQDGIIVCVNA